MAASFSSEDPAARLVTNVIAFIAICVGAGYVLDRLLIWQGYPPFVFCTTMPYIQLVLSHTVAIVLGCIAVIGLIMSGFSAPGPALLLLGALLISAAPGVIAHYLGVKGCRPVCAIGVDGTATTLNRMELENLQLDEAIRRSGAAPCDPKRT